MTPKKKRSGLVFRIPCGVEGHEEDWVEIDTGEWTVADYRAIYDITYPDSLRLYVERYCTNWHLTGDDGPVDHPTKVTEVAGRQPGEVDWKAAYKRLGDEGFRLVEWLATTPLVALGKRLDASKKSDAGGEGTGQE